MIFGTILTNKSKTVLKPYKEACGCGKRCSAKNGEASRCSRAPFCCDCQPACPMLLLRCIFWTMHSAGPVQHPTSVGFKKELEELISLQLRCVGSADFGKSLQHPHLFTDHHKQVSHNIASLMPASSMAVMLAELVIPKENLWFPFCLLFRPCNVW